MPERAIHHAGPLVLGSVKKMKIATSEKTPVHKSATNGTGTRAKKRFRQGERPTLLSRILLPLSPRCSGTVELRRKLDSFIGLLSVGFLEKEGPLRSSLPVANCWFFSDGGFVFGRLQFFSRTMPWSCEPLLPGGTGGRRSTGQNLSLYRTNHGYKPQRSQAYTDTYIHLSTAEDFI